MIEQFLPVSCLGINMNLTLSRRVGWKNVQLCTNYVHCQNSQVDLFSYHYGTFT